MPQYPAKVITAPTTEPVSIEELKRHLRVDGNSEDELIEAYGIAARQHCEWLTGQTFMETTLEQVFDDVPDDRECPLVLGGPLQSVTFVKYTDSAGTVTTWSSAYYSVNTDAMPGFIQPIYGQSWPSFVPYGLGAVRVRYVAGPSSSPLTYPDQAVRSAIKLLVGGLYENRESEVVTDRAVLTAVAQEYGVTGLLRQFWIPGGGLRTF